MRSPKLFTRGLLIALAGVTALAACSSSKAKAAAGGSATTAASAGGGATGAAIPAASPDPAAQGQVPSSLKSKGTLTVAMDATYAPDEFTAPDGHTLIGMDVDLMQAVGQVLGLKMSPVNATFNTIIPGLLSGKFDVGASSFTDTKEREKQLDFVTYFSSGEGFYVPANSSESFDGLDSLFGHKVSVESGTTEETDANSQKQTCGTEGKPTVTVLTFQDQNGANLAVSSGRAEAGFSDSQVAAYIVQQSNGQFKLSGQPFATAPYGIGVPKNGLAPALLAAIKDLMSSGIYTKILDKWGIASGAITTPVINGATS